jgi:hypothetical protein
MITALRRRPNSEFRSREHLIETEVEKLIEAAKDIRARASRFGPGDDGLA